jgi:hypothetical protein
MLKGVAEAGWRQPAISFFGIANYLDGNRRTGLLPSKSSAIFISVPYSSQDKMKMRRLPDLGGQQLSAAQREGWSRVSSDHETASVQSLLKFGLDPIVPLKDAAALLGCHVDTVRNREREGKIKILRMSPRRLGVHVSEIRRFMAACAEARAQGYLG